MTYAKGLDLLSAEHGQKVMTVLEQNRPSALLIHLPKPPWSNIPQDVPWWIRAFWAERENRLSEVHTRLVDKQRELGGAWALLGPPAASPVPRPLHPGPEAPVVDMIRRQIAEP